jgi:hypothetical protein
MCGWLDTKNIHVPIVLSFLQKKKLDLKLDLFIKYVQRIFNKNSA